jgi:glycerate kinase
MAGRARVKIVAAPNAFRGSLGAAAAAERIAAGVRAVFPDADIVHMPIADGGDGTMEVLLRAFDAQPRPARVTNPLGEPVEAAFAVSADGTTGLIEMASASGNRLLSPEARDALRATTWGTGELIRACLDAGCTRIIVGLGGSATVDCGAGMAQALGVRLLDASGESIGRGGAALAHLHRIDMSGLDARLRRVSILIACDVSNPLLGAQGGVRMFSAQKGATDAHIEQLETALTHCADVIARDLGVRLHDMPFTGAAGGLAGGLHAFLGAPLQPGIEVVLRLIDAESVVRDADLVITGEGRLDSQSIYGKAPIGIAQLAAQHGVPTLALVGMVGEGAALTLEHGLTAYLPIADQPMPLESALARAGELLESAAERAMRVYRIGRSG